MKHFSTHYVMNLDNMDNKIDVLNNLLCEELEIEKFKLMHDKMLSNDKILEKINKIKTLQKEIVFFNQVNKKSQVEVLEREISKIYEELDDIPIYNQYVSKKMEINIELKNILSYMQEKINKKISEDKRRIDDE